MFEFFRIWILVVGIVLAIAGSVMAVLAGTRVSAPIDRLFDAAFWPDGPDETTRQFQAWAFSVTFAVMAGWGILVAFIAAKAFPTRDPWAWWSIATSLVLWYLLDTGRSVYHRVSANVILNTTLLVVVAIPLAFTYSGFH